MQVSNTEHQNKPWRIHTLVSDFTLLDVWEFSIRANKSNGEDFFYFLKFFIKQFAKHNTGKDFASFLFRTRYWLGEKFGWDKKIIRPIPGCNEISIRKRVTSIASNEQRMREIQNLTEGFPFDFVYLYNDEALFEISNQTVHALLHIGWVEKENPFYTGQMSVYVKTRGVLGWVYMPVIEPFRKLFVYPALMKNIRKSWKARTKNPGNTSSDESLSIGTS